MEVEAAGRRVLLSNPTVAGYVQTRVYKNRLEEALDGTGRSALVVRRSNGWASPEPGSSKEFPIMQVMCYADPSRGVDGQMTRADAVDKAWALARAVVSVLSGLRDVVWGAVGSNRGLLVVSCERWTEPYAVTDRDRHGEGSPLGDMAYVVAEFALVVAR